MVGTKAKLGNDMRRCNEVYSSTIVCGGITESSLELAPPHEIFVSAEPVKDCERGAVFTCRPFFRPA